MGFWWGPNTRDTDTSSGAPDCSTRTAVGTGQGLQGGAGRLAEGGILAWEVGGSAREGGVLVREGGFRVEEGGVLVEEYSVLASRTGVS